MKNTYRMRLDKDICVKAIEVYKRYDISLDSAVNAFLAKSIEVGGLPFAVGSPNIDLSKLNIVDGPILLDEEEFFDEDEAVYDKLYEESHGSLE